MDDIYIIALIAFGALFGPAIVRSFGPQLGFFAVVIGVFLVALTVLTGTFSP